MNYEKGNRKQQTLEGIICGGLGCGKNIPSWYTRVSKKNETIIFLPVIRFHYTPYVVFFPVTIVFLNYNLGCLISQLDKLHNGRSNERKYSRDS